MERIKSLTSVKFSFPIGVSRPIPEFLDQKFFSVSFSNNETSIFLTCFADEFTKSTISSKFLGISVFK